MKKNGLCYLLPIILAWILITPGEALSRSLSNLDLIEKAYRNGEIGYREALNQKVTAVFRPELLPAVYRAKGMMKSATPVIMEAMSTRHLLTPENARFLAKGRGATLTIWYESGIELLSFVSPDRHFRIHYTVDNKHGDAVPATDNDSDGIPDYVERFADILDSVWSKEVVEMGYDAPPSDGTEGGDCLLDVYLADTGTSGFYGFTQIDEGDTAPMVYMIFDNDFVPTCSNGNNTITCFPTNLNPGGAQEGAMKVAAAHEFSHTVQFQITEDIYLNGWWMEASATWMEDYVYPEVNDYINYIGYWFEHQGLPLDTYAGLFPYGTAVWVRHMTEKYGSGFVHDAWNKIKDGESALSAVENALIYRGTTLADELKELRVANVTMTYDDGQLYETWDSTNTIGISYDNAADFSQIGSISYNNVYVSALASRYYSFSAPAGSGYLQIGFDGDNTVSALSVMVIGFHPNDTGYDVTEILTDAFNDGSITVNGFSSNGPYRRVVVIPLNHSTTDSGSFSLTASYTTIPPENATFMDIEPDTTSLITGDSGTKGKQQYYLIMFKDSNGNQTLDSDETQVLENSVAWDSDSSSVVIDTSGLAYASDGITAAITASLNTLSPATATLAAGNSASMSPGTPRNCTIRISDGRCFIATAAFGSPLHPYVGLLREFRDRYMLTNPVGRWIVSLYYLYSPPLAEKMEKKENLRKIVKISLIPVIILSGLMVKTTVAEKIIAGVVIGVIVFLLIGVEVTPSPFPSPPKRGRGEG